MPEKSYTTHYIPYQMSFTIPILILIGRPASGKSEIISSMSTFPSKSPYERTGAASTPTAPTLSWNILCQMKN